MRKIIAVVLTVLMLASALAVLPASAAATTYDGTTKTTEGLNKIMITEIATKATYHPNGAAESQDATVFPLNFMELYNNQAGDVTLSNLSILQAVSFDSEPSDETNPYLQNSNNAGERLWRIWAESRKFVSKIDIKAGAIVDEATAKASMAFEDANPATPALDNRVYAMLTNEGQDATISNGENVVLWFIDAATVTWLTEMDGSSLNFNAREAFIKSFYGMNANVADYTVLMVWAHSQYTYNDATKVATDMFLLTAPDKTSECGYVYAVANNDWDIENDVAYSAAAGINDDIYNMVVLDKKVPRYDYMATVDMAATFGLPTIKPYIANAYEALTEINPTEFSDAFAAGLVQSYREGASLDWAAKATPGTMPAWQWAMVAPEAYDGFKTEGALDAAKVTAAINAYITERKLVDNSTGREENDDRDYNFISQEELKEQFYNSNKKTNTDEDGMSIGLIIGIIAAAVVVVGAGAAVVVIILLKKKKAAAAPAVEAPAADAPVADAPAADAPVEAAPAEEEKKDE